MDPAGFLLHPECSERCWVMQSSTGPRPALQCPQDTATSPGSQWGHPAHTSHPQGNPFSPPSPPGGQATAARVGHGPVAGPHPGGTPRAAPPGARRHPTPRPSSSITHVPIMRPERQGLTHRGRRPAPILSPAINALDQCRPPAEHRRRGRGLAPCTSPPQHRWLCRPRPHRPDACWHGRGAGVTPR